MNLSDLYLCEKGENNKGDKPVISFEVYPPKDDIDYNKLDKLIFHLKILKKYNPAFISLTYGAGGTTQNSSFDIIKRFQKEVDVTVMPHFTCVGTSRADVERYLSDVNDLGIKNILALRGDIPHGMEQVHFDFEHANDLVSFIKSKTDFSIGVAGYPEGHIECLDFNLDLSNLRRKVDAGADAIFTQMFFDNEKYFKFVEMSQNLGINVPIIPGILTIKSYSQLERMLSMVKVSVPNTLMEQIDKYKDDSEAVKKIGMEFAISQCQQLIESGVKGLHFFTLNTSTSICPILDNLGF